MSGKHVYPYKVSNDPYFNLREDGVYYSVLEACSIEDAGNHLKRRKGTVLFCQVHEDDMTEDYRCEDQGKFKAIYEKYCTKENELIARSTAEVS